ncbi:MAG: hypothetical protein HY778_08830 [Betaproteobacteria bacterium]|nr:hypothetical protein [Betaproteobacteria bacterium]
MTPTACDSPDTAPAPSPAPQHAGGRLRCLFPPAAEAGLDTLVDAGFDGDLSSVAGVVLPGETEQRARELLLAGAPVVYLGEAALLDCGAVERLIAEFGGARVGVYAPARRMAVSWSFDTVSNADFRVVTPSLCEPAWEILRADGSPTGTFAGWWIGEMFKRGAASALLRVDLRDDVDYNLCAGLVEDFGQRLWLGPLDDADPPLEEWLAYGHVSRLVLPHSLWAGVMAPEPAAAGEQGDA